MMFVRQAVRLALVLLAVVAVLGCAERVPPEVVVYATVDREVALPLFAEFTKATGITVRAKYVDEFAGGDGGSVDALVKELTAARERPTCDLFWDDELLATLELERAGVLSKHESLVTDARVLVVNTNQVPEPRRPESLEDLTDPQWYERVGIAKPLSGPSATEAAALFAVWGDAKAKEFYVAVKRNARIFANDQAVAQAVADGTLAFGLTNASDALAEQAAGAAVEIVYPDQGDAGDGEPGVGDAGAADAGGDAIGTLFVPSTVAMIKKGPHAEEAAKLLEFLTTPGAKRRLAKVESGGKTDVAREAGAGEAAKVREMKLDAATLAETWATASATLKGEFGAQ